MIRIPTVILLGVLEFLGVLVGLGLEIFRNTGHSTFEAPVGTRFHRSRCTVLPYLAMRRISTGTRTWLTR